MKKERNTLKRIGRSLAAVLAVLIVIVAVKTAAHRFPKAEVVPGTAASYVPSARAVERLSGGLRIPTVSVRHFDSTNSAPFDAFKRYIYESYPALCAATDTSTVNGYGMLFRWRGKDAALNPVLLLSHYDVVPVAGYDPAAAGTEADTVTVEGWDYPPFSGAVAGGRIYGRGALDMKGMLFSILEAADSLIGAGFVPQRDVWFAFGPDEEVGGFQGAQRIAARFRDQGIRFDAVYDEGGIVNTSTPGLEGRPVALVGTGEKGFLTLAIRVYGTGGHSSMPPAEGSLVRAARIITELNARQMPARIIAPTASFLDNISGERGLTTRMAVANRWLFGPLLLHKLEQDPASNALVRTTTAVTMAHGSDAPNVLSTVSEATVNFRLLPGDSVNRVVEHVQRLCRDYDVVIDTMQAREASGVSPTDVQGYRAVERTASAIFPGAIVTPYVTIGGTDAYKYQIVSDRIYRFMPVSLDAAQQRTIHSENESISVDGYGRMIAYFTELIRDYDRP